MSVQDELLCQGAFAASVWRARCIDAGHGTDDDVVFAPARAMLLRQCAEIAAEPIVYDEAEIPCQSGVPACPCAGYVIRPSGGASAEFSPGTKWALCNGDVFTLQPDGNLVLYSRTGQPIWASWTYGYAVSRLVMQVDGNFVLYDKNGVPVWATGTSGNPGAFVAVQEDGNIVLYGQGKRVIWSTGTFQR